MTADIELTISERGVPQITAYAKTSQEACHAHLVLATRSREIQALDKVLRSLQEPRP